MPNPDAAARGAFLAAMLARPEVEADLAPCDVAALAAATGGFSGSDMACLCRHAAMAPVRELLAAARRGGAGGGGAGGKRQRLSLASGDDASGGALPAMRKLVAADFEAALRKIRPAAADARDGGGGG